MSFALAVAMMLSSSKSSVISMRFKTAALGPNDVKRNFFISTTCVAQSAAFVHPYRSIVSTSSLFITLFDLTAASVFWISMLVLLQHLVLLHCQTETPVTV
jgi:hypothetical protein